MRYRQEASYPQDRFRGTLDDRLSIFEWNAGANLASIIIGLESWGSRHVLGKLRRRVAALAQPIQSSRPKLTGTARPIAVAKRRPSEGMGRCRLQHVHGRTRRA
jgi:hypothetical protein